MAPSRLSVFLLTAALCAMVCDGEIHPKEMEELQFMVKELPAFQGEDLDEVLSARIHEAKADPFHLFESFFLDLRDANLEIHESLLVLEFVIRTIRADARIDPAEVQFTLSTVRALKLPWEVITSRFGALPFVAEAMEPERHLVQDPLSTPQIRAMLLDWGLASEGKVIDAEATDL